MKKRIQHLSPYKNFPIDVLRLDLMHPLYGGNKYFKLKYNVEKAVQCHTERLPAGKAGSRRAKTNNHEHLCLVTAEDAKRGAESEFDKTCRTELSRSATPNKNDKPTILTFGGAHSNHIYSTAAYCNEQNIKSIGVIRGEENVMANSPTLQFAQSKSMHLHFISREKYKNKTDNDFVNELKKEFGDFYLIPEGGNNDEGIKGCIEILNDVDFYDYVFCTCGTACTYSGILASAKQNQTIIGISVLKGENELIDEVNENALKFKFDKIAPYKSGSINSPTILNKYHFGGYAKHDQKLLDFKKKFEQQNNIPLDYIYTSKLFYAVYDLIDQNLLEQNKSILIIHSGGQQGNAGYEARYKINP